MAIAASSVLPSNSLEDFRLEFNNLVSDVTGITSTNKFTESIIFEGATTDAYETTLTVTDPTADRTITIPNETGTLLTSASANPASSDGAALGSTSLEWSDLYLADGGVIYFGDDQDVTLTHIPDTSLTCNAMIVATTLEPTADTSASDNAAIGYTAAEGLILTGQGSTSDITFKNDADTTVFTIPTGTDDILFPDDAKILVGTGSDLEIFHDGSHSYIKDNGTGDLKLQASDDVVIEDTSGANAAVFNVDAGQELYWRGGTSAGVKFATTQAGGTLTGTWEVTTALVPDASDGAALGTTALEWSDLYLADGAVIGFGDDQDVTLTHVADAGLLLNSSMYLTFRDSALKISSSADGQLDIDADTEVEITATTVDLNGNLDVSGTYTGGGLMTTGGNIVIPNDGNIGSVGDTDAIAISSAGVVTFSQTPVFSGDSTFSDDISLSSDSAVINFGADSDITLTHAADTSLSVGGAGGTTGLIINNTATDGDPFLAFSLSGTQTFTMGVDDGDSDKFKIGTTAIGSSTAFSMDSSGNVAITGDLTVTGDDLYMNTNTSGYVLVADGTNYNPVAVSGDVTMSAAGAITIAANAVEGSMLNNNTISGLTALTSGLATTDELMVSDGGTLKRMDVSVLGEQFADVGLAVALG